MKVAKQCFNLSPKGRCTILNDTECSHCEYKIVNPTDRIKMLAQLIEYNKQNPNYCAKIRKEINQIKKECDVADRDLIDRPEGSYNDWFQCYMEDLHRGTGGGQSEGNSNSASLKQKMKDNRPLECKMKQAERQQLYEATKAWEGENGKLDRLSKMPFSRNKVDSYTGDPIE